MLSASRGSVPCRDQSAPLGPRKTWGGSLAASLDARGRATPLAAEWCTRKTGWQSVFRHTVNFCARRRGAPLDPTRRAGLGARSRSRQGYTDNVVDLMVGQLTRLPLETQAALQQIACLGNVAEDSRCSRSFFGKSNEDVRWIVGRRSTRTGEHPGRLYKFHPRPVQEDAIFISETVARPRRPAHRKNAAERTYAEKRRRGTISKSSIS